MARRFPKFFVDLVKQFVPWIVLGHDFQPSCENTGPPHATEKRLRRLSLHCQRGTFLEETAMSIIAWIILGLIAGFIASKIVNKQGEGMILDIVLGVVGAIVGGFIFSSFGYSGVTGLNIYSMIVAVIGAIVVLWIYHAVAGRRSI
jgi:uncharacterized membrane protein YeaQ/YmgE (transglycosylase-associated protein family)